MSHLDIVETVIETKRSTFTDLADRIWDFAEIRFKETKSAAAQIDVLRREGFRITSGLAGIPTAFMAEAGEGGKLIAILGEYDALAGLSQQAGRAEPSPLVPGANGHGCGHNLLGTAGLAAAVAVKEAMVRQGLAGRVRYYGCPAEEGGSAKTFMARDGLFSDVDAAVTWHPGAVTKVMTGDSLANVQAYFRFSGHASHAAATPHLGRSALDAVELMNVGANYLREHIPQDARMHYAVTNTGGISPNVVQASAEVLYLIRHRAEAVVQDILARVKHIAAGAALMTGTEVSCEFDRATSALLPNQVLERVLQTNLDTLGRVKFDEADRAFGSTIRQTLSDNDIASTFEAFDLDPDMQSVMRDDVLPLGNRSTTLPGSTDVADVSRVVPTAQFFGACYAVGTPFHTWQLVAQGKCPAAHKGMLFAAKAMAGATLDLLRSPETIEAAWAEYRNRTRGRPYHCPIPAQILPPNRRSEEPRPGVKLTVALGREFEAA